MVELPRAVAASLTVPAGPSVIEVAPTWVTVVLLTVPVANEDVVPTKNSEPATTTADARTMSPVARARRRAVTPEPNMDRQDDQDDVVTMYPLHPLFSPASRPGRDRAIVCQHAARHRQPGAIPTGPPVFRLSV